MCPRQSSCLGGLNASCVKGNTGPLCAVCDIDKRYFQLNGQCYPCLSRAGAAVLSILIVAVCAALIAGFIRSNSKNVPIGLPPGDNALPAGPPVAVHAMTLIKITISYTQVLALIPEVYTGVEWPTVSAYRECRPFCVSHTLPYLGILRPH